MRVGLAEECSAFRGDSPASVDVELQEGGEGPVDRVDFGHVDRVAEGGDLVDVVLRERQGGTVREPVPRAAVEARVGARVGPPAHVRGPSRRGRGRAGRGGVSGAHGIIVPHRGLGVRCVSTLAARRKKVEAVWNRKQYMFSQAPISVPARTMLGPDHRSGGPLGSLELCTSLLETATTGEDRAFEH